MNNTLSPNQLARQQLRKQIQQIRSTLSVEQQQQAEQALIPQALALIEQYQAHHLAFYLPFNDEISPLALMKTLREQGKTCYLPIMHPFSQGNLLFCRYDENTPMKKHRFGMLEPKLDVRNVVPLTQLEMIFTPLVACDKQNGRLGYGGGFYDRTLSQAPNAISVGLAHQCQQLEKLPLEAWDMPLDHLIVV